MRRTMIKKERISDRCEGCGNVVEERHCSVYLFPCSKWRAGDCPVATHLESEKAEGKKRVGQQKQRRK